LLPRQRREKDAQPRHLLQLGMRLEGATDEGVSLEESIAPPEQHRQVLQVQSLQVATHPHHHIALPVAQLFDLLAMSKVIVLPSPSPGLGDRELKSTTG